MGIQIQRSLPYLRSRGVDVTVLTYRLPRSISPLPEEDTDHIDRVLASGLSRLATLQRVAQFRRYFEDRKGAFDILHCDLLSWEFLLNIGRIKALGLPIIMEMVLLDGDDPVATSRERLGALKMRFLRQVDVFVGISGAFLPRVLAAGIPGERFHLVHPGVDVELYRPLSPVGRRELRGRLGLPVDSRIVVSAGSVIKRKGVDRLLHAWNRMRPIRGRDFLLIVGPADAADGLSGSDLSYAEAIRVASRVPEINGTVHLVGRVENVHEYFAVADLFLFLSRQEGLPIVSVEALAAGLPCIVSPLDGIDEIVVEGKTGFIVRDPDDAGAVAERMTHLLDRPLERATMSGQARAMALARFSFEARADNLAALYRDLAARSARSSVP
jgi:glycosyltransferase involved in cell wall biosynthesis